MTNFTKGSYSISSDRRKLQYKVIHDFLTRSYWAHGRTIETVKNSVKHSECFGLYYKKTQVGFARVITDKTTYAYVADVFIIKEHRGKGLSKWLMDVIINKSHLKNVRRWFLATEDAHALYKKLGFENVIAPDKYMEMTKE